MKKMLAIMMALVMCCSLIVCVSADEEDTSYIYEGEGFRITTTYDLDDSLWAYDVIGDGSRIEYYLYSEEYENLEIEISVEKNENGYKFVHNMYNDAVEGGEEWELTTISGRDAIKYSLNTSLIYTYSDEYVFFIEAYGYEEDELAAIDEILAGLEITATASAPSQEDMEAVGTAQTTASGEQESESSSTVIIIVVAAVAVVAVVAVIIVVSKKKKA